MFAGLGDDMMGGEDAEYAEEIKKKLGDLGAQSAESMYTDMLAREAALRRELGLAPQLRARPPGEGGSGTGRALASPAAASRGRLPRHSRSKPACSVGATGHPSNCASIAIVVRDRSPRP